MNWIEISPQSSCSNACSYCPQGLLAQSYTGEKSFTVESFQKLLDNVDKTKTQIHFSGFSEVFLHPKGHIFIEMAHAAGFQIALFSTLMGFTEDKAKYLKDHGVVLEWVRLHEFDGKAFRQDLFDKSMALFNSYVPCNRFETIRITQPVSRGGALWDPGYHSGPVHCGRFWCNVALPDGSLALCCSDWGLKHVVGNIFENHYDSEAINSKRIELRDLALTVGSNILCKTCEMGDRR